MGLIFMYCVKKPGQLVRGPGGKVTTIKPDNLSSILSQGRRKPIPVNCPLIHCIRASLYLHVPSPLINTIKIYKTIHWNGI